VKKIEKIRKRKIEELEKRKERKIAIIGFILLIIQVVYFTAFLIEVEKNAVEEFCKSKNYTGSYLLPEKCFLFCREVVVDCEKR
jgi:hypothetical protein